MNSILISPLPVQCTVHDQIFVAHLMWSLILIWKEKFYDNYRFWCCRLALSHRHWTTNNDNSQFNISSERLQELNAQSWSSSIRSMCSKCHNEIFTYISRHNFNNKWNSIKIQNRKRKRWRKKLMREPINQGDECRDQRKERQQKKRMYVNMRYKTFSWAIFNIIAWVNIVTKFLCRFKSIPHQRAPCDPFRFACFHQRRCVLNVSFFVVLFFQRSDLILVSLWTDVDFGLSWVFIIFFYSFFSFPWFA